MNQQTVALLNTLPGAIHAAEQKMQITSAASPYREPMESELAEEPARAVQAKARRLSRRLATLQPLPRIERSLLSAHRYESLSRGKASSDVR